LPPPTPKGGLPGVVGQFRHWSSPPVNSTQMAPGDQSSFPRAISLPQQFPSSFDCQEGCLVERLGAQSDDEYMSDDDEPGFSSLDSVDNATDSRTFAFSPKGQQPRGFHRLEPLSQTRSEGSSVPRLPPTLLKIDTSSPILKAPVRMKRPSPPLSSPGSFKASLSSRKKKRPAPLHLPDALSITVPKDLPASNASAVQSIRVDAPSLNTVNLNELAFENITCEGETKWGGASQKGRRRYMEDTFRAVPMVGDDPRRGFFGVFDGHGGRKAADFAAEYLADFATRGINSLGEVGKMFTEAFLNADKQFCETAEREGFGDGTTAVVSYLRDGKMIVANVGDSRAVLSRGGVATAVTHDHKAESETEQRRIESKGGTVFHLGRWRVEGVLAVTRAIGDKDLKKCVTAHPDVFDIDLTEQDELLIMASDGLWDVMSNQEAVDIALAHDDLGVACDTLVKTAISRGSNDNVSAVIVNTQEYR